MAYQFAHFKSPQEANLWCDSIRKQNKTIGFVPTMGALHSGHVSLFQRAQAENDITIVSIFVNPLQFNSQKDLNNYPRNLRQDIEYLKATQVDTLFTGTPKDFLGDSFERSVEKLPDPGIYADGMEGSFRPGHFAGVREIVSRLFDFVGPCRAYFGEKDYQQGKIIQRLAEEMHGIDVILCPTLRAKNGLALSSRNQRLSPKGLEQAVVIYQAMQATKAIWAMGEREPSALQRIMFDALHQDYFKMEYAEIRNPEHWTPNQPVKPIDKARAFVAGQIEGVRLIDTLCLSD